MNEQYEQVREFMRAFGQDVPTQVQLPSVSVRELRDRLNDEEWMELCTSLNVEQYFDAVLDLLYVVLGAGVAAGFTPEQIAKGFAEVHRSNMSKAWSVDEMVGIKEGDGEFAVGGGKATAVPTLKDHFIVRRADGKVIKSPSYSPANLGPILEGKK